jgi:hypothetical protein
MHSLSEEKLCLFSQMENDLSFQSIPADQKQQFSKNKS